MRIVDAHLHLWDPALLEYDWLKGPLARAFGEAELAGERVEDADEELSVFVQAGTVARHELDEVRWVESVADAAGIVGIVAGARLHAGAATAEHLGALAGCGRVVGVRHLLQDEPDGLAETAAFVDGARLVAERGWTFDACVRARQIPDVTALADAVPELRVVLDHLGKPAVGAAAAPLAPGERWLTDLRALAEHPQVRCKLSGLPAESGGTWTDAQVAPFLDAAAEAFGPDRLMWGSDWPVSSIDLSRGGAGWLAGARRSWFRTVAGWADVRGLDADALFRSNALAFYGIR